MVKDIQLETERLLLRMIRLEDFEAYAALAADPEVMRYLGGKTWDRLESWRHMCAMVGHWHFRGYGIWAVEEKGEWSIHRPHRASLSGNLAGIRTWLDARSCSPGQGIRDGSCAARA
jgi:RimJ/RimL family protein N-acetyltransferase